MPKKAIEKLLDQKGRVIVAIDGPCASGKTTLAEKLSKQFDAFVIHMDDFFLRPEQRTAARLAEPGGNLDRERFLEEVLFPLQAGKKFSFSPYLCSKGALGDEIEVPQKRVYIIEGSYSHHPLFGGYDLKIFLEVSPEIQKDRLAKRNPEKLSRFLEEWIPMEKAYFDYYHIRENADVLLSFEKESRQRKLITG